MIRFLTVLVTVLAGLYGGYWFIGRAAVENGASAFLAQLAADGWGVSYSDLSTTGFPSRFDTSVTDVSLTNPATGITWATPLFQAFALSYRPTRVIAAWPERQIITLPQDRFVITADGLRASAGVNARLSLPLDAVTLESGAMQIDSDRGYRVGLGRLLLAFRDAGPGPADYDFFLETTEIAPPAELIALIDPTGALPAALDILRIDSLVVLDQPIDRNLRGQVRATALTLREARISWGDVELSGTGALTIASDGTPEGSIALVAQNWPQVISLAVAAGVMTDGVGSLLQRAGMLVSGGSNALEAPLTFQDGLMSLGPIPLGPAPKFN
jgi:hypothetical protein